MKLKDILWGPYQLCVYFFVGVVLYALSVEASAKTYIEWKNQAKFLNLNESIETIDHLRLGHKWKNITKNLIKKLPPCNKNVNVLKRH